AARTLGLSERQVLTLVRGPQAFRLALAPMTNDFVAMLKDSSLVSVLTVLELTKQTQIFATNLGSWVIPGSLCAALYLAMSLPLPALVGGPPIPAAALRELRRKVGMVFQFHCLFEHLSALANVCLAPVHAHGIPRDAAERRGLDLLKTFGVDHRADALPRHLSGGEAQRVAIARALAVDPPVLLMDEPTASLDPERRAELGALLGGLRRQGRTLVIATHDEDFAREFA